MNTPRTMLAAVATIGLTAAGLMLTPAQAAKPEPFALTCDGHELLVRVADNHSSDQGGWSAAVIQEGGSGVLVPTSFTFSAYDETTQEMLFSGTQLKGGGNGNHTQETFTCQQSMTGTLADLLDPGEEPPPGVDLTDTVTATFEVAAFTRP